MYLFFCGYWSRSSHCSHLIWRSLLSCKHGKWVKAIKSISFSLNQTQWICSKWCFGWAGRCSIQLLKRAFNILQKKGNIWIKLTFVAHIQSLHKSFFVAFIFKTLKKKKLHEKKIQNTISPPCRTNFSTWLPPEGKAKLYNQIQSGYYEWRMQNYIVIPRYGSCIKRGETQQRNYFRQLKLL